MRGAIFQPFIKLAITLWGIGVVVGLVLLAFSLARGKLRTMKQTMQMIGYILIWPLSCANGAMSDRMRKLLDPNP